MGRQYLTKSPTFANFQVSTEGRKKIASYDCWLRRGEGMPWERVTDEKYMEAVREAGFHSMVTNFSIGVVSGVINLGQEPNVQKVVS